MAEASRIAEPLRFKEPYRVIEIRRRGATPIAYLNRTSDLDYVLARRAADGHDEPLSHE